MNPVVKGALQGAIPTLVLVGGTNLIVKKFRESKPVFYWGSLAVATGVAIAVVQGRIPAPFMKAETFGAEDMITITGIDWETDGEDVDLPTTMEVPADLENDEIADYLSDQMGWLVNGFVMGAETFGAETLNPEKELTNVERQMVDSFPFNGNLIYWKWYASEMPNSWSNFPQSIIEGVVNMNPSIIEGVEYDDEIYFISSNVYSEEHNNESHYGAEIVWYDTKGRSQKQFFEDFMKANRGKKHGDWFNDSNGVKYGFGLDWSLEKGWAAENL